MIPDFKNMPREEVEAYVRKMEGRERRRANIKKIVLAVASTMAVFGIMSECRERTKESARAEANPIKILAPDLWQEFSANGSDAERKYDDAYLLVGGEIAAVGGAMRRGVMYLAGSWEKSNAIVHVQLKYSELDKTSELRPGNKVLLSCKGCSRSFGSPNLSACKVVQVGL